MKFRVIADSRGYEDIIDGTKSPPDEKEVIEILPKDNDEVLKAKKEKLANKKGYRDLVMSTEGISLNIVENATSDKLSNGDLRKVRGRLKRRWNPKPREDKVEAYTKFLNYKPENTRQKPMDWLIFLENKQTELANTGHKMDDEMFITHLLNSLPQSEYMGAILVIKDKLRKGDVELPVIEQNLEDKYQAIKHVKGWDEEEDDYALFASQSNKKKPKKAFKGCCGYCGEFGHKAADCPNKEETKIRAQKAKISTKRNRVLKETTNGRDIGICQKLNVLIVVNMDILHEIVQKLVIMLILLKKVSKTRKSRICWIWTISV